MSGSVIGAQLYTLRDFLKTPDDMRTTFGRVREMGYDCVQCSALGPIEAASLPQVCAPSCFSSLHAQLAAEPEREEDRRVFYFF